MLFLVPSRAPNGVRVRSVQLASDLLVEWNPLPQYYANGKLLGYTIYYKEYDYWSPYKRVNTTTHYPTQLILKGLKGGHGYQIQVAAFTSKGVGPRSYRYYATTGLFSNDYFCLFLGESADNFIASCSMIIGRSTWVCHAVMWSPMEIVLDLWFISGREVVSFSFPFPSGFFYACVPFVSLWTHNLLYRNEHLQENISQNGAFASPHPVFKKNHVKVLNMREGALDYWICNIGTSAVH